MTPFVPTTLLSTAEAAEDCTMFVISLTPIEKLGHLMMVLPVVPIVSVLPTELKDVPAGFDEVAPTVFGLARLEVADRLKQAATDSAISLGLKSPRCWNLVLRMPIPPMTSFPQQTGNSF